MVEPGSISVLIRTFNSGRTLAEVLERLAVGQEDEVLVVDSGSTDATLDIAGRYRAKVFSAPSPFHYSKSLNLGFQQAQSPWVLVLSSHCIPLSKRYVPELREAIAQLPLSIAVAYGPCPLAAKGTSPGSAQALRIFSAEEWRQHKQRLGGNTNALYRRELWFQHRFDEAILTAEDLEWFLWAVQKGYGAAQVPALTALYRNQASLQRMFTKGYNEAMLGRQMLGSDSMPFSHLCIGLGSFLKKALFGQIPLRTFPKQCAQQFGAFLGSRRTSAART
jgi:glycosyltransferase involved in cell wall biosynthesis